MKEEKIQERGRVIGMDLHPSCFSASAFDGSNMHNATHLWTHDKVALEKLESWAKRQLNPQDIVVVESGSNSFECCSKLRALRIRAIVLESYSVGRIGDSHLKSDVVDSMKIAQVYLSGLAKEVWQPDEQCRERREILSLYQRATKDGTCMQNRITSWCTQHALQRPKGMTWMSAKSQDWLMRQKAWTDMQKLLIAQMFDDLHHAKTKQANLKRHMAEAVMNDPQLALLLQIAGIRHITAYALAAIIGDISRFKNPKKLVSYIGLNPRVNESGINKKSGRLAHNGRKDVRHFLVQGAMAILRQDPSIHRLARWGQALAYRKGKQVACIAVARKLLTAVWYLLSGFKHDIKEITASLTIKLKKIMTDLGKVGLENLGYSSRAQFLEEKSPLLIGKA